MIESNVIKGFKISCKKHEELRSMAKQKGVIVEYENYDFFHIFLKDGTHYIIIIAIGLIESDAHEVIYSESLR